MVEVLLVQVEQLYKKMLLNIINEFFREKVKVIIENKPLLSKRFKDKKGITIFDLDFINLNKLKLIRNIKELTKISHTVFISNRDETKLILKEKQIKVNDFLLKPIRRQEFMDIIDKVIVESYHGRKEIQYKDINETETDYKMIKKLEKEICERIIKGTINSIDSKLYMEYLDFFFEKTFAIVISFKGDSKVYNAIKQTLMEISITSNKAVGPYCFKNKFVCFLESDEWLTNSNLQNLKNMIKKKIDSRVKNSKINIGIGRCYSGINNIKNSYDEACGIIKKINIH